jgi:hypothetical protein
VSTVLNAELRDELLVAIPCRELEGCQRINDDLFVNGHVNLSFFRLVGISDGVSIVFPGVYSVRQVKDLVSAIKEALKILVNNYIKIKKEG